MVAVAHVDGEVLVHRRADGEAPRLLRIDADDAEGAGLGQRLHRPAQRLAGGIARLPVGAVRAGFGGDFGHFIAGAAVAVAGALGVHAHRVYGAIDADAAGQPAQRLHRVLLVEIDDLRALLPGHAQAVVMPVDGEDPRRAHQPRAGDGELAHRAAAEHRHRVPRRDLGQAGAEVAGGEDVGEQDRLVVADVAGQPDQADVGVGYPRHLRLQAVERAGHGGAAIEGGAGVLAVGVGVVALRVVAGPAVGAVAAGDGGGHHDTVADFQVAHVLAELLDYAYALVAEDGALLHAAHRAAHEVQVGAADGGCGQADDGVGGRLENGIGDVIETDVPHVMKNHGFHTRFLWLSGRAMGAGRPEAAPCLFRLRGEDEGSGFLTE
ncbi:hypothetical protein D9M71_228000 [compost metagenome]